MNDTLWKPCSRFWFCERQDNHCGPCRVTVLEASASPECEVRLCSAEEIAEIEADIEVVASATRV